MFTFLKVAANLFNSFVMSEILYLRENLFLYASKYFGENRAAAESYKRSTSFMDMYT